MLGVSSLGGLVVIPTPVRFAIVALIATGLATLPALAHMSPPDPSWVSGIYDDADYDDVITLIASAAVDLGPPVLTQAQPAPLPTGSLPPVITRATRALLLSQVPPRAPPLTTSLLLPVDPNLS